MANRWVLGARPRTLPAAVVPVAVGTGAAAAIGDVVWWRALAALVAAVAIQIGTNYANDYSDGVRGTDDVRVGPPRLVASRLAAPDSVRLAAIAAFATAAVPGVALAATVGWELLIVGVTSFAAGWLYTGGPRPYGYAGLGEVFVFVFFGLVATVGSAYVHTEEVSALPVVAAVPVGLLATAMLVVNNLRDVETDAVAGKRTLAVRVGEVRTRWFYVALLAFAFASLLYVGAIAPLALSTLVVAPLAVPPARRVLRGERGPALIAVLGATGRLQIVFGAFLAATLSAS